MLVGTAPHPREVQARQLKAGNYVYAMLTAGVTPDQAAHMDDTGWENTRRLAEALLSKAAARRVPVRAASATTRRLVVALLAQSANARYDYDQSR